MKTVPCFVGPGQVREVGCEQNTIWTLPLSHDPFQYDTGTRGIVRTPFLIGTNSHATQKKWSDGLRGRSSPSCLLFFEARSADLSALHLMPHQYTPKVLQSRILGVKTMYL